MITRTGLFALSLLTFSTASWSSCESYVGLGIGPESANFRQKSSVTRAAPFNTIINFDVIDKTHLAGKGSFGSLFAGYAMRFAPCDTDCENLYLALEANADVRSVKFKFSNDEVLHANFNHTTYKMGRNLGISLLPGYLLTDCTLFYARLGYANGRFSIATTDISLVNMHKNLNGFRYGIGIRQAINDCFAVRMDYSHINYKRVKMSTFDPVGFTSKSTSVKPTTNRFELGIIYTF